MSQLNASRNDLSQIEVIQSGFKRQLDQINNSLKLLDGDTQSLGSQMQSLLDFALRFKSTVAQHKTKQSQEARPEFPGQMSARGMSNFDD